jgi:hypothetical protein
VFDAIAAHGRGATREQAGELRLCSCSRIENEPSNTYGCDERLRRLFIAPANVALSYIDDIDRCQTVANALF